MSNGEPTIRPTPRWRFFCTNCKQEKQAGAPPDHVFLMMLDKDGNLESYPHNACYSCVKIIEAHNAPIEARITEIEKNAPKWEAGRLVDESGAPLELEVIQPEDSSAVLNFSPGQSPEQPKEAPAIPPPSELLQALGMIGSALGELAKGQQAILEALKKDAPGDS